jgi:hypothetical protein
MFQPSDFPARFTLSGAVLNVFQSPAGVSRDGRDYGGDYRVQLMSCDHLKNDEPKLTPTDVSIGTDETLAKRYRELLGKIVRLPVSVYAINGDIRVSLADPGADPSTARSAPTAGSVAAATGGAK